MTDSDHSEMDSEMPTGSESSPNHYNIPSPVICYDGPFYFPQHAFLNYSGHLPSPFSDMKPTPFSQLGSSSTFNSPLTRGQSRFKNEPKKLLEYAKRLFDTLFNQMMATIQYESEKSGENYRQEGAALLLNYMILEESDLSQGFKSTHTYEELQTLRASGEVTRASVREARVILKSALEFKRFVPFLPILNLLPRAKRCLGDISKRFFDHYNKSRSSKYFKEKMKNEEILYWLFLVKIVLLLIPQEQEYLELLPLKKENVPFMYWLIDSQRMPLKKKSFLRTSEARNHLRAVFDNILKTLTWKASEVVEEERWSLQKRILLDEVLAIDTDLCFREHGYLSGKRSFDQYCSGSNHFHDDKNRDYDDYSDDKEMEGLLISTKRFRV